MCWHGCGFTVKAIHFKLTEFSAVYIFFFVAEYLNTYILKNLQNFEVQIVFLFVLY